MYFQEFSDGTKEQLLEILKKRIEQELQDEISESPDPIVFINEKADDWINRNNFDMILSEWAESIENADV